jgi:hypothetical protein
LGAEEGGEEEEECEREKVNGEWELVNGGMPMRVTGEGELVNGEKAMRATSEWELVNGGMLTWVIGDRKSVV